MLLDKRKKKIYDAAIKLFYEHGYLETTVRDIAKKMGVSAASLYSDLESKDDLLIWICNEVGERFEIIMENHKSFEGTDKEKFVYFIRLHIEQVIFNREVFGISWDYWQIADAKCDGKYSRIIYKYFEFIKGISYKVICENQSAPFFQEDVGVLTLVQVINHVPKWVLKTGGKYDLDCISQEIAHRFLNGYSQ